MKISIITKEKGIRRKPGNPRTRGATEDMRRRGGVEAEEEKLRDGSALQMTFTFFAHHLRVRAPKITTTVAYFHSHTRNFSAAAVTSSFGGSRPLPPFHRQQQQHCTQLIEDPEVWFVKVVSTLCRVPTRSSDRCISYLSKTLSPFLSYQVVIGLQDRPELGLEFFQFTRLKLDIKHSLSTYCCLLRSLCQFRLHDSARLVLDCMKSDGHFPDNAILRVLVSSFAEAGEFKAAEGLLSQLQRDGVDVGCSVYNSLLNILVKQKRVDQALSFFKEQLSLHFRPDTCTFNIIIRGLCRGGEASRALEFYSDMEEVGCSPDVITYNTLIDGLCKVNEVDKGHGLLDKIQSKYDFSPDIITYTSVISGYCKLGKVDEACILFDEMTSSGVKPTTVTYNVLINGFGKAGDMAAALAMYKKMLILGCFPDVVTFTSLIDGYCRTGQVNEGMRLWQEMTSKNLSPNEYTFAILINSLCKENRLDDARGLLRHPKWMNIVPQPFMYNPVIDGFCKAGNVDEANAIVGEMEKRCRPDKLTFTILIIGHCVKGRMFDAISIFKKMLATGCMPDTITVSSLISCLLKAGMPNEAAQIIQIAQPT